MTPVVSIVLPVFNVGNYIERCLISILHQTYTNIEVIVVDDGSQDLSIEIVQDLIKNDKRVRIISQENLGLGAARNTGLKFVTGSLVVFVDGDDWIEAKMVEILVNKHEESNADIICSGFNVINGEKCIPVIINDIRETDYLELCLSEVKNRVPKITTTVWATMFSVAIIRAQSINFKLRHYEDTPFFIECVFYANKVAFVNEPLYNYIVRFDSISNSVLTNEKIKDFYHSDHLIQSFLSDKKIFLKYESRFSLFHLARIFLYGGYLPLVFSKDRGYRIDELKIFILGLSSQQSFLRACRTTPYKLKEYLLAIVLSHTFYLSGISFRASFLYLKFSRRFVMTILKSL